MKFSNLKYFDGWSWNQTTKQLEYSPEFVGWHVSAQTDQAIHSNSDYWFSLIEPHIVYECDTFVAELLPEQRSQIQFKIVIKDKRDAMKLALQYDLEGVYA